MTHSPNDARQANKLASYLSLRGVGAATAMNFSHQYRVIPQWPDITEWIKGNSPFLTLYGTNGSGKTWAALATMAGFHRYQAIVTGNLKRLNNGEWFEGCHQLFKKFSDMWLEYTSSYAEGTTAALIDGWKKPSLLVIDDIGIKAPTPGFLEAVYALLDHRMEHGTRTILTTNLPPKELATFFGLALASRILSGKGIEITGPDRRRKSATT